MNKLAPRSEVAPRTKDREKTELELRLALNRVQKRGKVNITVVAREAGVTPALLHNVYPDLAEEIRVLMGKATREQRDSKHELLIEERRKNRELRMEVEFLTKRVASLASVNESLRYDLVKAQAKQAGKLDTTLEERRSNKEKDDLKH